MAQIAKNSFSIFVVALAVTVFSFVADRSASAQTVKSGIQKMSGWQSCSTCAGSGGSGPASSTSTSAGISSPSMSGDSRVFTIAGTKAYSDALWWKQLGAANGATHLVYNLYFYLKTPQDAQAIEFDSNQANGHMRWIFGTQCDIARDRWEVYANADGSWTSTGIPCGRPSAYKWHHLIWEFSRTSTKLTFLSVTLDGAKHYVNRTYTGKASSVSELNVAFQLDQNANHVAYSAWLDNVSLKYW